MKTLLKAGKLGEVKMMMKKAELDILGICEIRWAGMEILYHKILELFIVAVPNREEMESR